MTAEVESRDVIIVIDGGFRDTGDAIAEHVQRYYSTTEVGLVVSTHPDADHLDERNKVVEQLDVQELLIHRPRLHVGAGRRQDVVDSKDLVMEDDANRKVVEQQFADAMRNIYIEAKRDLGYNAAYFLQMLATQGPIATARRLILASTPSEGFTTLWERRRLDLTVEAHVIQPRFTLLFSEDELDAARARLAKYGYQLPR